MKSSKIELHQMNLTELNNFELNTIEGGGFWSWVAGIGLAVLAVGLTIGTGGLSLVTAATAASITEIGAGMFCVGWIMGNMGGGN